MSDWRIIKYNEVFLGTLEEEWDGNIKALRRPLHAQYVKFGWAAFQMSQNSYSSLQDTLERRCRHWGLNANDIPKLYFSPHCKIRRDLFRNSGFQIVMDPDRADCVIIPHIKRMERQSCNLATWCEETGVLTLWDIDRYSLPEGDHERELLYEKIKNRFTGQNIEFIFPELTSYTHSVYFMPKYDVYEELLNETGKPHAQETDFKLNPPINISVETLRLWQKIHDDDLQADAICNSDWQDYPVTVLTFLKMHNNSIRVNNGTFNLMLNTIGFDRSRTLNSLLAGRVVQPKDWNMLQDYLMSLFDLPETGGLTNEMPSVLSNHKYLFRCTGMVKPKRITSPMGFNQLCNINS